MVKSIKEIRAVEGFDRLSQRMKSHYIEFIHDVLADEFSDYDRVRLLSVYPSDQGVCVDLEFQSFAGLRFLSFESEGLQ